jgi:hypothetical protein
LASVTAGETTVRVEARALRWRTELEIRGEEAVFRYRFRRTLTEGETTTRERVWEESAPRDFL